MTVPAPLVKSVQTTSKSFMCPMCGKGFPTSEAYEGHVPTCPSIGMELGRMYVGKRMLREERDGNLLVLVVRASNMAVVTGSLVLVNPRLGTVSVNPMTFTVEDLREWHMVSEEEAVEAVKKALMSASERVIGALRGA